MIETITLTLIIIKIFNRWDVCKVIFDGDVHKNIEVVKDNAEVESKVEKITGNAGSVETKAIENNLETEVDRNILISLPVEVLRFFLNTWIEVIEVKNICDLDNAFCNKKQRVVFLNILNDFVIVGNFCDKYGEYVNINTELYLKWIIKRNIFLNNLYINQWNNEIANYFQSNTNNRNLYFFIKSLTFNFELPRFQNFEEKIIIDILNTKKWSNLIEFICLLPRRDYISDWILDSISNNCKNLKILDLFQCYKITDNGIISISKKILK
jgi:hypothetical protein